jgi:hypothetical protein
LENIAKSAKEVKTPPRPLALLSEQDDANHWLQINIGWNGERVMESTQ